ncbi:MAG: ISNCY family transposase [Thermodesulfovibrionales bacterium]
MAGKDIIMVRQRELKRLHIIRKVIEGAITQVEASEIISLSERQIRRIVKRIREEGDAGISHRSRGKASNRKLPKKLKDRVIELYRQRYKGFGPTLTSEKLSEIDGIDISDETVRNWLIEEGEWKRGHKRKTYRQWRERKAHCGEMLQIDGSHHDWFEGRGAACVLMGYIDDATGRAYCRFYGYEGTIPAMDSFKRYIKRYGIPVSAYMDKHTTYKSPAKQTVEEEIEGIEPLSEFGRALRELGVELIHANSPQAKGRVERMFRTLQDRLVKEMRLRGIGTIQEANKFLKHYMPLYNKKFARAAQNREDLHRTIPKGLNLDSILCLKTERTVRNDNTIIYKKKLYQIEEPVKGGKVTVEGHINGKTFITSNGKRLKFKDIEARPERQQKRQIRIKRRKPNVPLSSEHPWKKFNIRGFMGHNNHRENPIEAAA